MDKTGPQILKGNLARARIALEVKMCIQSRVAFFDVFGSGIKMCIGQRETL